MPEQRKPKNGELLQITWRTSTSTGPNARSPFVGHSDTYPRVLFVMNMSNWSGKHPTDGESMRIRVTQVGENAVRVVRANAEPVRKRAPEDRGGRRQEASRNPQPERETRKASAPSSVIPADLEIDEFDNIRRTEVIEVRITGGRRGIIVCAMVNGRQGRIPWFLAHHYPSLSKGEVIKVKVQFVVAFDRWAILVPARIKLT